MPKMIILFLVPLLIFAESTMKCEAGKCASANTTTSKNIPKKEENNTQMKCAPGKCSSGGETQTKVIPKKPQVDTAMKCESGKCSQGSSNTRKEIPQKIRSVSTIPTIKQLFNVKTVKVKEISSGTKQVNYGYITAQDSRRVDVYAWYSGFVDTLYANTIYQKVKKGDLLAKVYSPEVFQAKQDYLNSIHYNRDHNAPAMLQSAMTKLALLGVSQQEILKIEKEGKVNEFTMIYAPISGWIFTKNINKGSSFNSNKKLFEIVNLDEVWAEVKLFQNELEKLDGLHNFKVTPKNLNKTYDAQKSILYPMLDPKEATATLRLIINNESNLLKPGMYVKVNAFTSSKSRLIIPRTAAIRKNGVWYAFLATEFKGEYEPVQIDLKPFDKISYEVTKGLRITDTVVNNALFMMDSDAQINGIY